MGERIPLLCSKSPPPHGLGITLRDALARIIEVGQIRLRVSIAAVGRGAVPRSCFSIILKNSITVVVNEAKPECRSNMAAGRKLFELAPSRDVVAADLLADSLCEGVALRMCCRESWKNNHAQRRNPTQDSAHLLGFREC